MFSEANDDNDTSAHDEIDAIAYIIDDDDDLLHSSDDNNSDSSEDLLISETKKRKMNKHQKNVKRSAKKTNQISEESDDSDMLDDFGDLKDDSHIPHKEPGNERKRKVNATFKIPEPCKSDTTRIGKVRPSQSTTGKGPAKQRRGEASDRGRGEVPVRKGRRGSMEEDDGSLRVDQTLAGSFTDVGDVFGKWISNENERMSSFNSCGNIHTEDGSYF